MNHQQHFIHASFQAGRCILHIINKMCPEEAFDITWLVIWPMYKLTDGLEEGADQSYVSA